MNDLSPSHPVPAAIESEPISPDTPATTPNQVLATRVTGALIAAGLLPSAYQEQCETLLAEGQATGTSWTKFLEKPADSSTSTPSSSHA